MLFRLTQEKVVYIMRGISGSGKSTLSQQLGEGGAIFSTDDFFMVNGEYQFDRSFLGDAHFWNKSRAIEAMEKGVTPIVIDNTHVEAWEAKPYAEAAQSNGYRIEIQESQAPWKFDAEELAKRNSHGVPREIIDDMLKRWQPDMTVDDIMQSEKPRTANARMMFLYASVVIASIEDAIQNLGLAPDVSQYIISIPDQALKGQVFNYARQNPAVSLVELQRWQPQQSQSIDPYLPDEYRISQTLPQVAQKWALVNLKTLRNSDLNLPTNPKDPRLLTMRPDLQEYTSAISTLDRLARTHELEDLINSNPNFNIDSYDIFGADELAQEWHQVMAGKGEGLMYSPTSQNLIVFGPDNWADPKYKGWTIQEVRSENDLLVEGNKVGQCVGSYCDRVDDGAVRIFSLRDPSNDPFVTMEAGGSEGNTPWRFKQILGDGPKSGNANPRSEYKMMIGEWLQTLNNPSIDSLEENPYYEELQSNNVYPEDVQNRVDEAISYNDMADYGLEGEVVDWDLESMYDAALYSLRDGAKDPTEYSYRYADDVGETLAAHALDADMKALADPNSHLSENNIRTEGANRFAISEFQEKFMKKNYNRKSYKRPYFWEYKDQESELAANAMMKPHERPVDGNTYENDTKSEYLKARALQIINTAGASPEVDKELHKHMISVFDEKSYVGELMELGQSESEQFWESNMDNFGDTGLEVPDRDNYETDDEFDSAYATFEIEEQDIQSEWEQEMRSKHDSLVLTDAAREWLINSMTRNPLELPKWMSKYNNDNSQLQWLAKSAVMEQQKQQEQKVAHNWYQIIKIADGSFIGFGSGDEQSKQQIIEMINGLARNSPMSEGEKEGVINQAVGYISTGYDSHFVMDWVRKRMAA